MLPHALYESLPYLYLLLASFASAMTEFNGFVLACALLLSGAAALILRMRHTYRRTLRLEGGVRRIRT